MRTALKKQGQKKLYSQRVFWCVSHLNSELVKVEAGRESSMETGGRLERELHPPVFY